MNARDIFIILKNYFNGKKNAKQYFGSQLEQVKKLTKIEPTIKYTKIMIDAINEKH